MKDFPQIGVCPWRQWSQEAACYVIDPRGRYPFSRETWLRYRHALRMVRKRPLTSNPWRQCFARYAMTPKEAFLTIRDFDPAEDAADLRMAAEFDRRWRGRFGDDDGGQIVDAPLIPIC